MGWGCGVGVGVGVGGGGWHRGDGPAGRGAAHLVVAADLGQGVAAAPHLLRGAGGGVHARGCVRA